MTYTIQGFLAIAMITAAHGTPTACPDFSMWKVSKGYLFNLFTDQVTYQTAKSRCESYGGRLASGILRDPATVRYIIGAGYLGPLETGKAPWIGYTKNSDGVWSWVDGGSTNSDLVGWQANEPNNNGGQEFCAHIRSTENCTKMLMNDLFCTPKMQYICEISIISI